MTALLINSGDFVSSFEAPDYTIDLMLLKKYLYCMTAPTGFGKTAVLLTTAMHKITGTAIGYHSMDNGRVVYLAGENWYDVQLRWIKMCHDWKVDPGSLDIQFMRGVHKLSSSDIQNKLIAECTEPVDILMVDTSSAYFEGSEENANMEALDHAKMFRKLISILPGHPTGIIACHPRGNFDKNNIVPRGGTAFFNEIDGGMYLWRDEGSGYTELCRHHTKFRGPLFDSIPFGFDVGSAPSLLDKKGRSIQTVVGRVLTDDQLKAIQDEEDDNAMAVLKVYVEFPGCSYVDICRMYRWVNDKGYARKSKVQNLVKGLEKRKYVTKLDNGQYEATANGKEALSKRLAKGPIRACTPSSEEVF
jgi:hypothetical protein